MSESDQSVIIRHVRHKVDYRPWPDFRIWHTECGIKFTPYGVTQAAIDVHEPARIACFICYDEERPR